jgi:hypothetical protein
VLLLELSTVVLDFDVFAPAVASAPVLVVPTRVAGNGEGSSVPHVDAHFDKSPGLTAVQLMNICWHMK